MSDLEFTAKCLITIGYQTKENSLKGILYDINKLGRKKIILVIQLSLWSKGRVDDSHAARVRFSRETKAFF